MLIAAKCFGTLFRGILLAHQKLLLLRREIAPPQLVLTNPSEDFFPAFKRERHGGEINLWVLLENGITIVSINKSVDKSSARVGDTLTYTVQVSNGAGAEVNIRDTVMRDAIPDGLTFRGNVTVDGYSTVYQYDNENRTLSVPLDAIAPGQTKTISFDVLVNSDAYGMMIENTAVASGSNAPDTEDTDDGVTIENGTPDGRAGDLREPGTGIRRDHARGCGGYGKERIRVPQVYDSGR